MTRLFNKSTEREKRRILRNNPTLPEVILWLRLKNKQVGGYKFRRQYSIGPYVIDLYCPVLKLAIEIDGSSHFETAEAREYDIVRQDFVESFGVCFLRFTNEDVKNNIEIVIEKILETCKFLAQE